MIILDIIGVVLLVVVIGAVAGAVKAWLSPDAKEVKSARRKAALAEARADQLLAEFRSIAFLDTIEAARLTAAIAISDYNNDKLKEIEQ